jgi:hypothetical protein
MSVDRKAVWFDYVRKLYEAGVGIMNEADKMAVGLTFVIPRSRRWRCRAER